MAGAYQQAEAPKAARPVKGKPAGKKARQEVRGLQALPQAAGIAIMIVLIAAALFVGNFRALQGATPKAFMRWGDVKSIIEDRADEAGNALTVARRAALDEAVYQNVKDAVQALEDAKNAREISRADQKLTAAVSEMIDAAGKKLTGEDAKMLNGAAANFAEQGSFLRQEARSFNKQAKKAEALYEKLPTKFILPEPDVYEGID